jgi:hypothetical protein
MEHRLGRDMKPSLAASVPKKNELLQEGVRGVHSKHPLIHEAGSDEGTPWAL